MQITRIYTGDDGKSHFEDMEIALPAPSAYGRSSREVTAIAIGFREGQVGEMDFHPVFRRQLVITLEGQIELECGDGSSRRFGPGDVFLADDRTGQGHILRQIEGLRRSLVIPLSPDLDLDELRTGVVQGDD